FWGKGGSGGAGRAVLGTRPSVPDCDLLPRRHAASPGAGVEAGPGAVAQAARSHRDRDRGRRTVLSRGGVSPGLLQEEPGAISLLPLHLWAGSTAEGGLGGRCAGPLNAAPLLLTDRDVRAGDGEDRHRARAT